MGPIANAIIQAKRRQMDSLDQGTPRLKVPALPYLIMIQLDYFMMNKLGVIRRT